MKRWFSHMVLIVGLIMLAIFLRQKFFHSAPPLPSRQEVQLQMIEGWGIEEEIHLLDQQEQISPTTTAAVIGSSAQRTPFEVSWRADFPFLQSLPRQRSLEGYLFPDTYRVWRDELPEGLVKKQLQTFQNKFGASALTSKNVPLKTLDEVVILASIIEKEVREPADKKIAAGIFLKRLNAGMALQSDATLSYILDSHRTRATVSDLATDSLYNTYKHTGLPPGPICNPGEDSINAVLEPTPSPYWYFLTDREGKVFYARTLDEQNANKRKAGY
ncbi:endolytic transglycosylase MltG [Candidatus Uhrbacteria bacterium]|nr:endolytic transglycosylase MltG [Candidatus Uhrbacteria bacterium]